MELRGVLNDGVGSIACGTYLNDGADYRCTELDVAMTRFKFYGAIASFLSVAITMLMCWTDEPLLTRLNSMLCLSPLISTAWALFVKRNVLGYGVLKVLMMVVVLFFMAFSGFYNAKAIAKPKKFEVNFQDAALLAFLFINSKDGGLILIVGIRSYFNFPDEGASMAAEALVPFVAVDKLTLAVIMTFVLFFFDEVRKRVRFALDSALLALIFDYTHNKMLSLVRSYCCFLLQSSLSIGIFISRSFRMMLQTHRHLVAF